MKKITAFLLVASLVATANRAFAQDPSADSVDVLHYNLTIDFGATVHKQLRGVAEIQFVLTKPCSSVSFDLVCDTIHPVSLDGTVTRGFNYDPEERLLSVYLPNGQPGDTHTLSVPYVSNGYVESYGWGGLHMDNNIYYNLGVAFQEYPHVFGRTWFPCRDNMYDKATYALTVTSKPGWRSICSGLLTSDTINSDGTNTRQWVIDHPTPTYLVSVSSADWHSIQRDYQGVYGTYPALIGFIEHDSTDVYHAFDILEDVVPAFEQWFGPYRWDRIGYINTPQGSMEHVSNIGLVSVCMSTTDSPCQMTMCHEFGHAWFGNLVTCTTPGDMWINEGGASFCEEIAAEAAYGKAWADNYYRGTLSSVLLSTSNNPDDNLSLSGMPEHSTYGTTTYKKGALVWHSLRGVMGDSLFSASMKRLFASSAFGNIDAIGLRDSLSLYSGIDLHGFFDFNVFNPGFADFAIENWQATGLDFRFDLRQRLKGAQRYARNCTIPVTFFSLDRTQRHKVWFPVSDSITQCTVTLPFPAHFAIVDFDHELSDACTEDTALLTRKEVVDLSHSFCKVYMKQTPSAPSWIHVGHHFAHPGGDTLEGIVRISSRYWQITGVLSDDGQAEGRFLYNLGTNGSSGAGNIDNGFYERPATLDSLVLLYRPSPSSPWQAVSHHRTSTSTISTGYFTAPLHVGQYTLAVCDTASLRIANPSNLPAIKLYPNPSTASFRLDLGGYNKKINAQIFDTTGKKVLEIRNLNDGDTINHHLAPGTYILLIQNNFLSLQSQIIVQ